MAAISCSSVPSGSTKPVSASNARIMLPMAIHVSVELKMVDTENFSPDFTELYIGKMTVAIITPMMA